MDDRDVEAPWFEWQPSAVPVFFHPTERATNLVELKQLGQKVYALSWTRSQRSAFLALWRARGQAMREDTDVASRAQSRREDPPGWPAAPQPRHTPLRLRPARVQRSSGRLHGGNANSLLGSSTPAILWLQHSRSPMAAVGAGRRPLHIGSPFPNSRYRATPFRYGGDFCPQEGHL
jgi:hypothetical protein